MTLPLMRVMTSLGTRWRGTILLLLTLTIACSRTAEDSGAKGKTPALTLQGSGATFPYPVYARWFSHFASDGDATINYQSVGSGAGIRALLAGSADFAATDVPLDDRERRELLAQGIHQVPLIVGGAAVTYHVPGLLQQLRLDGPTLGDIFLGRIVRWNDVRIVALNPDVVLPPDSIRVVTRADTSGTSWILTDFLTRVSPAWAAGPGRSKYPQWPTGTRIRGNEGVASEVKATEYAIGVVEAVYAMQNHLPVARIRNHAGAWVTPQTGALRSAASAMLTSMDDTVEFTGSISDPPGEASYPIASLSWLVVPSRGRDAAQVAAVRRFVRWALEHGETDALALGYAPLPEAMRSTLLRIWSTPARE